MKFMFELLCCALLCLSSPAFGAWPLPLIPGAIKLVSTVATFGAAWWYKDDLVDSIPEFCYSHVHIPNYGNLHHEIFGQPLALSIVPDMFAKHIADPSPKKALMFYFHGWSGSGKTHMATLLLNRIYPKFRKNRQSNFVHTFTLTWYEDAKNMAEFQRNVTTTIDRMLRNCPNSAFIFDEIENLPSELNLGFLTKYIDYPNLGGVQHNKAVFILLGNSQGTEINTLFHRETVINGIPRHELNFDDFVSDIKNSIRHAGPLKDSPLLKKSRIRAIIPFLPLDRNEVKKCVILTFKQYGYAYPEVEPGSAVIQNIVSQQNYEFGDLYSEEGCHNIDSLVETTIRLLKKKNKFMHREF